MAIEAGQNAPEFERNDHKGNPVKIAAGATDGPVALVFYPFTFTGVCDGELCSLRDDYSAFVDAGVKVVAISCDPAPAHKRFAEEQSLEYSLVSDFWPHGEISRAYGVFNEAIGCAERATFLIGADGTVIDAFQSPDLGTPRAKSRYEEAIAKL